MTFYTPKPVLVEALRFEGGSNAMHILSWLARHKLTTAHFFSEQAEYVSSDGTEGRGYIPAQLDLCIPHVKIAEVGDYIVRTLGDSDDPRAIRTYFKVLTKEQFEDIYNLACETCSGQIRETVGLVCKTCGYDYSKGT